MTAKPVELASEAWFDVARAILSELMTERIAEMADQSFFLAETLTDVPPHLRKDNTETLSWTICIANGDATLVVGARADADVITTAGYAHSLAAMHGESVEPLAELPAGGEPGAHGRRLVSPNALTPAIMHFLLAFRDRIMASTL